jgi:hypothetical protein
MPVAASADEADGNQQDLLQTRWLLAPSATHGGSSADSPAPAPADWPDEKSRATIFGHSASHCAAEFFVKTMMA